MKHVWIVGLSTLAAGAIATLKQGTSVGMILCCAFVGALISYGLTRHLPVESTRLSRWEKVASWSVLLFLIPTFTLAVPPGADMAMHSSLARAILYKSTALSPAWGNLTIAIYPRGFGAWVAVVARGFHWFSRDSIWILAKASLLVSGLVYVLYFFNLRAFLTHVLKIPKPTYVALILIFLSKSPQSFWVWGGNPTIFAIAVGLGVSTWIARYASTFPIRVGLLAAMTLVGSLAIHPTGGFVALILVSYTAIVTFVANRGESDTTTQSRNIVKALVLIYIPCLLTMLALKLGGPAISVFEKEWIFEAQSAEQREFFGGHWFTFVWGIGWTLIQEIGIPFMIVFGLATAIEMRTRQGRIRVVLSLGFIELLAAILAIGPKVPGLGMILISARFVPLLALSMAKPIAFALESIETMSHTIKTFIEISILGASMGQHIVLYQCTKPIATHHDVELIRCVHQKVPHDALIDGTYGDASQWVPALTGIMVTNPHIHCTLFSEVTPTIASKKPRYRMTGERLRYGEPLPPKTVSAEPLCSVGQASLYEYP